MIDDLRAMAIFAETVRQGSFRGAARLLNLSPSVVSYHLTQLEKRLDTALIYRSTRKLSMTYEGEMLYQHALNMLDAAEQGLNLVSSNQVQPKGKLTVTLPAGLIQAPVSERIARFSRQYPAIEMNILYTDARQDLIACGIDLAIRAGDMEDSSLKSRRLGQIDRKLVCSSEYWLAQDEPTEPEHLASWHWISLAMLPKYRTLISTDNRRVDVNYRSHITVDSIEAATQFCRYGLGLSSPPDYLVHDEIQSGRLVEVLPNWDVEPMPLYAVWPINVSESSNTRRLLNYLIPDPE